MQRVALGRSGLTVSEAGLGMWQAGVGYTDENCVAAMRRES